MPKKTEEDYLTELMKLNNELVNVQRDLHKKNQHLQLLYDELEKKNSEIKILKSFLVICSNCKSVFTEEGAWMQIDQYITEKTDTGFSHGYCDSCLRKLFPDMAEDIIAERENEERKKK
ncbi:hypothetical protein [Candidatus Lokiarchaeum ossiferum]|uniref:hypothetical protein n=1 Tax=Candidatus Lokiarchaeum ossiferum TaxID=2951803 RepID=UPI00352EE6C0